MEKEFVTYEIALKLKEKGFDEPFKPFDSTFYYIDRNFSLCNDGYKNGFSEIKEFVLAPLYQQVIDWFRKEHKLSLRFECDFSSGIPTHKCFLTYTVGGTYSTWIRRHTGAHEWYCYHDLRDKAIEEALTLI